MDRKGSVADPGGRPPAPAGSLPAPAAAGGPGRGRPPPPSPPLRGHRLLPHTADLGIEAWAPTLEQLFEEAAAAVAEVSADYPSGAPPSGAPPLGAGRRIPVNVAADDLAGIAFAWLNELIGLADSRHAALVRTSVARVQESGSGDDAALASMWRLAGGAWLSPFGRGAASPRLGVKSATFHRLAVVRTPPGWRLRAYLDV